MAMCLELVVNPRKVFREAGCNPETVDPGGILRFFQGPQKEKLDISWHLIIFYEDRNFQGRCHECSTDCADLSPYFSRCNSIRVESDWWVVYERPHYMGYQYVLSRGDYPDYQRWMGFNDSIGSCRSYPSYRGGTYRMRIYERPDFGGQMMEFMDDCPSVYDRFRYHDIHSCQVMDGYWIFYEHPNYRGRQYFMRRGEYRRYSDWGGYNSTVGSFRRMRDF
ncbi:gamma-crystallin S-1-like [Pristis pectinata]|uniref:gamma-crystallin S-1-like n=1 Tax=Pristis pectinata TaxID=685728 RepID=UPI00223CFAB7|nr:gamma-crystallin S-1-like [Pristis pectinata]